MASQFTTAGSNVNNPKGGLIKQSNYQGSYAQQQGYSSPPSLLQSHTPTNPVKKMVDSQGNQVHFDTGVNTPSNPGKVKGVLAPKVDPSNSPAGTIGGFDRAPEPTTNTNKGLISPPTSSGTNTGGTQTPPPPVISQNNGTPQVGNQAQNAQNSLNAGQFTPFEQQAIADIGAAKGMQNYGQLAQNAEAGAYAGLNPGNQQDATQLQGLINRPDLVGRASGSAGLYGNLGNIFGSASQAELTSAEAQANRAAGQANTVLGYGQPQQVSPTNVPYNPLTGTYGAPASTAYGANGLGGIGGLLQQQQQGADTQTMIGAYNQAKPLIESAKQQIKASGFNSSPLALGNALQQYINKDIIPSGQYANIFNTLSEIATTISPVLGAQGNQTNLKTMIAQEFLPLLLQGKDLSTVFDTIEANALAKISANKSTATGGALNVPTKGKTGGATFGWNGQ